ncbi:DM13 domain-containing protein [Ochrobactrum sp. MR28]|nr:DM13 domain-containing protein [Ochrobactrum sp. MR28]MBX8818894.1 DM13 domain-containing protein [Ochrobactrum sp. MR31]
MPGWLILIASHMLVFSVGFAGGIYLLPILTAPPAPTEAALQRSASEAIYVGHLTRDLKGSDLLHWGEGEIRVAPDRIAHLGRLSPGPDYKLYLAPRYVDTKEAFLEIKGSSVRLGNVSTFKGFIVDVPAGVDVNDYSAVVIWCEAFNQFISAAEYQPPRPVQK